MKPSVGRIVLYTNLGDADGKYPPEQQAAIITKVVPKTHEDVERGKLSKYVEEYQYFVWIHIFYTTGQFDMEKVPFSGALERGHWTWPPRVE